MDIYNSINNHQMMNDNDIKNIINNKLKELNLLSKSNHVIFSDEKNLYFRYGDIDDNIYVSNDYRDLTLKKIVGDKLVKLVKKKDNNTFLTDSYNLELLISPYHEVRHALQYKKLIDYLEDYNVLINKSLIYMFDNLNFYILNHPRFLSEHDAELNALILILSDVEKDKLNVNTNSLYFFNSNIAYFLLESRGYGLGNDKAKRRSFFKSPLHMIYFYNNSLYLNKKIDKEEYERVNRCIFKIRNNNYTEYDRIISGDNLSDETIFELFLIANGKLKTKNIFKYFEEKEINKNNNQYIKKLLLK